MNYSSGQMANLLEEVNVPNELKMIKCIGVHNEADWIEYSLGNCYEEFDEIRVVEGAVVGRPGATEDGHSTDATLELIRSFPDPDNKITLYVQNRHFKSLEEQKQVFLDTASEGEVLIITDADEFYLEGSIDRIREAFRIHPKAMELIPTFLNFYRDFSHVRDYHPEWNLWHQRIVRYRPNLKYITHPVVTDHAGRCTYFTPGYQMHRYVIPNLYIFHYGYAKSVEFHKAKAKFYKSELSKFAAEGGGNASEKFDAKLDNFINFKEPLNSVLYYGGMHPSTMNNHKLMDYKEPFYQTKQFDDYKDSDAYKSGLPTIPQYMMYSNKMAPIMNTLEV